MKVTLERDVDVAQFEIAVQHNPDYLVVKVDGEEVSYGYSESTSTIELEDLKEGQTVEVTEDTPHTIEGEAPMIVDTYPTITRIRFKINSLDYMPKAAEED